MSRPRMQGTARAEPTGALAEHKTRRRDHLRDPRPGLTTDVGPVVEHLGDCARRNLRQARNIVNRRHRRYPSSGWPCAGRFLLPMP